MSATANCLNGSLLTLIINICAILLLGKQCRINNSESLQPLSKDDTCIKEEARPIKCESSPPTPRSLRLERVVQALALDGDNQQVAPPQHRSVGIPPAFIRYCFTTNTWLLSL